MFLHIKHIKWLISLLCISAVILVGSMGYPQKRQAEPENVPITKSGFTEGAGNIFMPFSGAWRPGLPPLLVGGDNYKILDNMRYIDGGIEGVDGYSKITNSIINNSYYKLRSGFHFFKDRPKESHILVQSYNSTLQNSKVYDNQTSVPSQGDFDTTSAHDDLSFSTLVGNFGQKTAWADTPSTLWENVTGVTSHTEWADVSTNTSISAVDTPRARFSSAPNGQVVYCNSVESQIWAGKEHRVAAFVVSQNAVTNYVLNGKEYSDEINNEFDDSTNCADISNAGTTSYWLIAATRPISGVSYYVKTANASAGKKVYGQEWNGTSWSELSTTDGTEGLTKSGNVTFPSTVATSKPRYLEGTVFYWYQFRVEGGASVYRTSLNVPWQDIVDIWDGVPRICVSFQVSRKRDYTDYTLEVAESSSDLYPIGAKIGGLTTGDHIIAMFSDKQQGVVFNMLAGNTNYIERGVTPYYWSGTTWTQPTSFYDGTSGKGSTPFATSGVIHWNPPTSGEFKTDLFGVYGYAYKFDIGGSLGGASPPEDLVIIDTAYGITAPLDMKVYKFPVFYKNRVFLCGDIKGNEANRVDYCKMNAADVWNGVDSSDGGRRSLYVGDDKELTGAASLFNRYGSEIFSLLMFFKKGETHVVHGESPDDFSKRVFKVSSTIGCPAPYTISTVEIGYELVSDELLRNVVVWLSATGPMMFDGSVMQPIRGIDPYFNKTHPLYVGSYAIENAFGWYDSGRKEWNLRVADHWFAYDLLRRKWFSRSVGSAELPQCAFEVTSEEGAPYIYAGIDTGHILVLDNGGDWDGTPITNTVETGDFFGGNNGWEQTLLRRMKLAYTGITGYETVQVTHYMDDNTAGTSLYSVPLHSGRPGKLERGTKSINEIAWSHRLKFENVSTTKKGFQPLGWGYQFKVLREDE